MKLLWITNLKVECEDNKSSRCGWLSGALDYILDHSDNEVIVAYPNGEKKSNSSNARVQYETFFYNMLTVRHDEGLCRQFMAMYESCRPDLIHIWGTEYMHTYAALKAAEQMGIVDKVVIHIQGLVSVCSKHYALGIPEKFWDARTLRDIVKRDSIKKQMKSFYKRGIYEQRVIKTAKYVIGRTSWDKACVEQINPDVRYLFCNEIMRRPFYSSDIWEQSKCRPHTVFISQAFYPVKGLQFVVEALNIVKTRYPDVKVYIAGDKIFDWDQDASFINKYLKISTYRRYLYKKICQYGLKENICFLGPLSAEQMKVQYLESNVFVSASTIENSCNSIVEAMLLGVPVISSYVGGVTDMIEHGKDGILYPCDEPYMLACYIMEIFSDADMAERISRNAREKAVRKFDRNTAGEELLNIYDIMSGERPN